VGRRQVLGVDDGPVEPGEALAGLEVRDLMTRDPLTVDSDLTVGRFMDEVAWSHRFTTYPVVEEDGAPIGLVGFAPVAGASAGGAENRIVEQVNNERAQRGLNRLTVNTALSAVARDWSRTMARDGSLRHNPRVSQQVNATVTSEWTRLGENGGRTRLTGASWQQLADRHAVDVDLSRFHMRVLRIAGGGEVHPLAFGVHSDQRVSYQLDVRDGVGHVLPQMRVDLAMYMPAEHSLG
jgi:CBS domain-containing protein